MASYYWIIIAGVGFILLQFILYAVITYTIVKKLMQPSRRTNDMLVAYELTQKKLNPDWLEIPYKSIFRDSPFGYTLHARLYLNEKPTNKFIICVHGHNNSSIGMLKYMNLFSSLGYNVFIPEHRRSGESGGDSITFGYYEKDDLIDWIDYLKVEYPDAEIGLFGESMGAATSIMVTAMDKRIKFLIEDCGYANFKELIFPYLKSESLYNLLLPGFMFFAKVNYKVDVTKINPLESIKQIDVPIMILHSKTDQMVYVNNAKALEEAQPKAEVHYFEKAVHARSLITYPEEYKTYVETFLQNNNL